MPTLRPFRDYDEHDVINLFSFSGTLPLNKGTFVRPVGSGWVSSQTNVQNLGAVGQAYQNVYSFRYGVQTQVGLAATGQTTIGCTLYDIREQDENGEYLKYNPRKAAEMEVILSGQAVPILTRGIVLYSGTSASVAGWVAGDTLYVSGAGLLCNSSLNQVPGSTVGTCLSIPDQKNWALIKINCQ